MDVAVQLPQDGHSSFGALEAYLWELQFPQVLQQGVADLCVPAHQQMQLVRVLDLFHDFPHLHLALRRQLPALSRILKQVDGDALVLEAVHLLLV